MSLKTLTLLISAACTLAGLWSGLAPARAEAATVADVGTSLNASLSSPAARSTDLRLPVLG